MSQSEKPLFRPTGGFMGAPWSSTPDGFPIVVFGVPFDCGTSMQRIGARHGPAAIRAQSGMLGPYHELYPGRHLIADFPVADLGDVNVIPARLEESFKAIEAASRRVARAQSVPLTFGGDGAVTLPQLRGLSPEIPDLAVLHIDSHTDTYPSVPYDPNPYNTATTFYRAADEDLVNVRGSMHLGFHGDSSIPNATAHATELGFRVITLDEMLGAGLADTAAELHRFFGKRPVYLCFDMDIFDPACAPGVCTPTWGGLTARQGLDLIRTLKGLNIVALDINTVSPPQDPSGMTAFLAATIAHEFLALMI